MEMPDKCHKSNVTLKANGLGTMSTSRCAAARAIEQLRDFSLLLGHCKSYAKATYLFKQLLINHLSKQVLGAVGVLWAIGLAF